MKLARLCMCLVLALALVTGCGGDDDDSGGSDEEQITAAINTFADGGSAACDVMTDEAVETLFGGRSECEEAAGEGESADVEVADVQVDGDTATAQGTSGGSTATINLEKDGDDWKISGFEQAE